MGETKVIGLFGPQQVGKSTLAGAMAGRFTNFKREKFAGKLYELAETFYGTLPFDKEEPRPESGGKSLREFLQILGTEFGRNSLYDRVWVDALLRKVERNHAAGLVTIVDDMRFQNEYDALKEVGCTMVEISREGYGPVGQHASEMEWQNFIPDLKISNDFRSEGRFASNSARELVGFLTSQ